MLLRFLAVGLLTTFSCWCQDGDVPAAPQPEQGALFKKLDVRPNRNAMTAALQNLKKRLAPKADPAPGLLSAAPVESTAPAGPCSVPLRKMKMPDRVFTMPKLTPKANAFASRSTAKLPAPVCPTPQVDPVPAARTPAAPPEAPAIK